MATLVLPRRVHFQFKTMVVSALCLGALGNVRAQTSERVRVEHSVAPLVRVSEEIGRVEAEKSLERVVLILAPSSKQEAEAKQFVDDLHNRNSVHFQKWLTPEEYGARFGAKTEDVQKVRAWLEQSGLQVEKVAKSGGWLEFSGTAGQVEGAFQTELHYYRANGKKLLANATEISLPAEVAGIARGVLSLNGFGKQPPRHLAGGFAGRDANGQKLRLTANLTAAGASNTYYVAPGDFAAIYNTRGLQSGGIDGAGVTIAVTAQSGIELTDVQMFRQIFGLKANDPNIVVSGPDPGVTAGTDAEEAMLDAEWAGAVAPGATVTIVVAGSTDTTSGVDLAAAYAIDNRIAPIVTYTFGSCEQALGTAGNAFYNNLWMQAAAEGITVVVATGDNGSAGCDNPNAGVAAKNGLAVNGVAATPFNVAVGGTEFADSGSEATYWNANNAADYSSAIGYIPESVWNDGCDPSQTMSATNCVFASGNFSLLASGGGASSVYTKPPWQKGTGVPADGQRDLPDVALAASSNHDNAVYCVSFSGAACQVNEQGQVVGLTLVGGTSVAAPSMAGILALVEQKNGVYQGQVNYTLYKLAQSNSCDSSKQTNPAAQNACVFYDVTAGSNAVPCAGGSAGCSATQAGQNGFMSGNAAGPGYDLATGLGSINATNLANDWKSATLAGSATSVESSSASFVHGTAVTISGTVAAAGGTGTPTGTVALVTDLFASPADSIAVNNGAFSASVQDLPGGQYNVVGRYSGDAMFAASESALISLNVTPEASTASFINPPSGTIGYGVPLALRVQAAGVSGVGNASGTVTLQDGATMVGSYSLTADGSAYIPTGSGSAFSFGTGAHSLVATYGGDNSFAGSSSGAVAFTVAKSSPFVVVGLNASDVNAGNAVSARAVVSGAGSALATGTVQFTVDGIAVGAVLPLQAGGFFGTQAQAAAVLPNLAAGTHTIEANYNAGGDLNYLSVASGDARNEFTQTVTVHAGVGTKTTTALSIISAPVNVGDTGTFAVTVSPSTATGTVTLWDLVGPRSAALPITGGSASIQIPWTQAGKTTVYAVYSGDASDAASASAGVALNVAKGVPGVGLAAPATSGIMQQVSLNASVAGNPGNSSLSPPTGIVEFWDAVNGAPAQLLTAQTLTVGAGNVSVNGLRTKFAAGMHVLHAHYRGDNNWQAQDSANVTVTAADFAMSVGPGAVPIAAGSPMSATLTLTPAGGFTGTVTLACGSGVPVGYTCSFSPASVTMSGNAPAMTMVMFTPQATGAAVAVQSAGSAWWGVGAGLGLLVWALLLGSEKRARVVLRELAFACGCVLCVASVVLGCGGGGGGGSTGGGGPVVSTTTLMSSNARAAFAGPLILTANVSATVPPTGNVQLIDNGQTLGTVTLTAGSASFGETGLPIGLHGLTAHYLGSAAVQGSTSAAVTQVVTGSSTVEIKATAGAVAHTLEVVVVVN